MTTTIFKSSLRLGGVLAVALVGVLAAGQALAQSTTTARPVTFAKDVAPILQKSCQSCHRPGSIAPMSLMTYDDARPWARSIKRKVVAREMPPWHIEKNIGIQKFKDDISLTDEEISVISTWVDSGMLPGNPADMPPPPTFPSVDAWQIGTPDLIVEMPVEYTVSAEGGDTWVEFFAPTGLTEMRYIKALQGLPGRGTHQNVHHLTATILQEPPQEGQLYGNDGGEAVEQFLLEYAMGKNGEVMPEGTAKVMMPGSVVKFQLHYHSTGEEKKDRSRMGFIFYPKGYVPKYHLISAHTGDANNLDIPPNEDNVRYDGYYKFDRPVRVTAIQAHMHNRGKRQCIEAIYPDMRIENINCFKFDFAWHKVYNFADDTAPLLPAGTIWHVTGWHNNSVTNRNNPDPRNWVGSGNRTIDEMGFNWTTWHYLTEEDYKRMVAERAAKQKAAAATNNQQ